MTVTYCLTVSGEVNYTAGVENSSKVITAYTFVTEILSRILASRQWRNGLYFRSSFTNIDFQSDIPLRTPRRADPETHSHSQTVSWAPDDHGVTADSQAASWQTHFLFFYHATQKSCAHSCHNTGRSVRQTFI